MITYFILVCIFFFLGPKLLICVVLCFSVSDAALRIVPTQLQVFEYGPVSFICEGFNVSTGWKVRNNNEYLKSCSDDTVTSTTTCTIDRTFSSDSGDYWCEGEGGERSNTVNITVTGRLIV